MTGMPREAPPEAGSTRTPRFVSRRCTARTHALVRALLERAGDKWTLPVTEILMQGPVRFTAILESVPGISHRMLTRTLRRMQRDGMLTRVVHSEMPPRVEYALTGVGESFVDAIGEFITWTEQHAQSIEEAQAQFDSTNTASAARKVE